MTGKCEYPSPCGGKPEILCALKDWNPKELRDDNYHLHMCRPHAMAYAWKLIMDDRGFSRLTIGTREVRD